MSPMADLPRFLTLPDVAEILNTSVAQVYAMVRRGDLPRDQDRRPRPVAGERADLEDVHRAAVRARRDKFIDDHPFDPAEEDVEDPQR